jgi:hypothetical protein
LKWLSVKGSLFASLVPFGGPAPPICPVMLVNGGGGYAALSK